MVSRFGFLSHAGYALRGAVLGACMVGAAGSAAIAGERLVAHRAVYDMQLGQASKMSDVGSLSGRMVYELTGDACEGYSVSYRFVSRTVSSGGVSNTTDLRISSYEDGEGNLYQFVSESHDNNAPAEKIRGIASARKTHKLVELREPEEESLEISSQALFPSAHLRAVIQAARAGQRFVAIDMFDGADTGKKVFKTTTVIGDLRREKQVLSETATGEAEKVDEAGEPVSAWPVTVAYFDSPSEGHREEQLPLYSISFLLYENGISRNLTMNYGAFSIKARLRSLELSEKQGCDSQ